MKAILDSIPIVVAPSGQNAESPAKLLAIIHEIKTMLEILIETGETRAIDLLHTPLSMSDLSVLKDTLGEGEVSARLDCLGTTSFQETSISGIWWVTHCNREGKVLAESVEATTCPEMLKSSRHDLRSGLALLNFRQSQQSLDTAPGHVNERLEAMGFHALSPDQDHPNLNELVKRGNGNAK